MNDNSMYSVNLELTTCCPLHCPQCYCTLEDGKHLNLEIAKKKLQEAGKHGVKLVHLSGGETMCYPYLYEVVECASKYCGTVNVALSGYNFDADALEKLIRAGISGIFISLNGSTEEINSLTRDGYEYALNALRILRDYGFKNTYINWVMHSQNADDFHNVVSLAEKNKVANVVVLAFKPDSKHELNTFPSITQILETAEYIKCYRGSVKLMIESCFSQLLAVIKDTKLFGNLNVGPYKGCRAGLYSYNINIDGLYSPCRHLDYFEKYQSLDDYLSSSETIKELKKYDSRKDEPCISCKYSNFCRPCAAVSAKLTGNISFAYSKCSINAGQQHIVTTK